MTVHDAATPQEIVEDPQHYYEWQYSGLAMFEILDGPTPALADQEPLISHSAANEDGRPWDNQARSVLVGDDVYFVIEGDVYSSRWGRGDLRRGPY